MESRHAIREAAFRALFALATNPEADKNAVYAEVLPKDTEVPSYLTALVEGVLANQAALDAALTPQLKKGWTLSRLTKPDLIIYVWAYMKFVMKKQCRKLQRLMRPLIWLNVTATSSRRSLSMAFWQTSSKQRQKRKLTGQRQLL